MFEPGEKSLRRIICSLGAALLALGSFSASQPASAQSAASRSDPARSQAVRNGDRAFDAGRFSDAEKLYTEACVNQDNGQACQRAGRFYDYEGANRRRAKASVWLSAGYFTKACATLKNAKACAIAKEKVAKLKQDISGLKRNANLNRVLIQNTVASRYKELARFEQAIGYRRKAFMTALEQEVVHRKRAAQLANNSTSTRTRLNEAQKRLTLHRALRKVKPASNSYPSSCIFYDPGRGSERAEVLNRLGRCYDRNKNAQLGELRTAARNSGLSVKYGKPFEVSAIDGTLNDKNCMCYFLLFEHGEDVFRIYREQREWRDRKGREWGRRKN